VADNHKFVVETNNPLSLADNDATAVGFNWDNAKMGADHR
jgi:hypothetical protein